MQDKMWKNAESIINCNTLLWVNRMLWQVYWIAAPSNSDVDFAVTSVTIKDWLRNRCTITESSRATFEGDYWMIQPIWNLLFDFARVESPLSWNGTRFLALPKCHGRQKVFVLSPQTYRWTFADKVFACLHWQVVCFQILAVWLYLCYRLLWLVLLV